MKLIAEWIPLVINECKKITNQWLWAAGIEAPSGEA